MSENINVNLNNNPIDIKFNTFYRIEDATTYDNALVDISNVYMNLLYRDNSTFKLNNNTKFAIKSNSKGQYQLYISGTWYGRTNHEYFYIEDEESHPMTSHFAI